MLDFKNSSTSKLNDKFVMKLNAYLNQINHNTYFQQFSDIHIPQGSVATHLRCGGRWDI